MEDGTLARRVTFPALVLYGLGTTVGAGMYALLGEVAGRAGMLTPLAFVAAATLAGFTALSFAELSSRFPRSAGEAEYVRRAFGRPRLAQCIGLGVVVAGSVSAGAVSIGFAGYVAEIVAVPTWLAILLLLAVLGGVAAWGIRETFLAAGIITLIEVAGLLLVVWAARDALGGLPQRLDDFAWQPGAAQGIVGGATLAFFAFLGFEDMVNVAEEVVDVRRTLPRAIFWTLGLTTLLYAAVSLAAILAVPPDVLADSEAPLAEVWRQTTGRAATPLAVIGILAMVNGALVQIVMASRILYGLARQGALPESLGVVHPRTRTPVRAVGLVTLLVAVLALALPIAALAEITALLALVVFATVNAALWRIHRREGDETPLYRAPPWVPIGGLLASSALVALELHRLALGS